ncbi:MAG TPA: HDIG domain-containing protein [Thermodesulfovibrionia bacterium]|nr:HDIG domain-containing protein [Thermodesulfovibrionia bacterium]
MFNNKYKRAKEEKTKNTIWLSRLSLHITPAWRKVFIVFLLIFLTTGTIAFFITDYTYISIPDYKAEDIARKDIIAAQDFEYVDEKVAKITKENAVKSIHPVYDYNPAMSEINGSKIRTAFKEARELLKEIDKMPQDRQALENKEPDDANTKDKGIKDRKNSIYDAVVKALDGKITEEQFKLFLNLRFSVELENLIVQVYTRIQSQPIVNFDSFETAGGAFKLRNIVLKDEKVYKDTNNILQLKEAYIPDFVFEDLTFRQMFLVKSFIYEMLVPNVNFNSQETKDRQDSTAAGITPAVVKVKKGKVIVRRGDEVTEEVVQQIDAIKKLTVSKIKIPVVLGNTVIVAFLLLILWGHIAKAPQIRMTDLKKAVICFTVMLINVLFIEGVMWFSSKMSVGFDAPPFNDQSYYNFGLPYVMGTMLVTLLVNNIVALTFSVVFSVIGAILVDNTINTFIYIFFGSIAAIYAIDHFKDRSGIVKAGFVIGIVNAISFLTLEMLNKGAFEVMDMRYLLFGASMGLFGGLLTSVFVITCMPLFEALFQVTTEIKLLELSNMDVPILRKLAEKAPGTYQHSLVVGTLAEAAAKAISANQLLTRVACYYHDIGKTVHPHFFIENQRGFNIHDHFTPEQSAEKIIAHVPLGLKLAKEMNLPPDIQDIMAEHHGTKRQHYFYEKSKEINQSKGEETDDSKFRYPGPKPKTKESAIVMLADVVEAASRTIKEPTPEKIRAMVHMMIDNLIKDGQFSDCKLTIGNIEVITASFLAVLSAQFHHRIQYQGLDFDKEPKKEEPPRPAVITF